MSEFNHNGQQKNLMQIFMSYHRELFGLVKNYDSPFFLFVLLFVCCAIMFIFFLCKLELFWAWPSYTRIPTNQISYSYSYSYAYETPILCSCRLLYWSHADSRIFSIFQHPVWVKSKYRLFVPSFVSSYRSRCLGKSVSPSPVFCATDSL